MKNFPPDLYGNLHALHYDELFGEIDDNESGGTLLHKLADGGDALEFGIGTGRLAIPLSSHGTHVYGVDISEAMLDQLRAKTDVKSITVIQSNFIDFKLDKPVSLVYCVFSTLFMLEDQEAQVKCIENAAAHLPEGGRLLIDMFVHDRTRFTNNQESVALSIGVDSADFRLATVDPNGQVLNSQRVLLRDEKVKLIPNRLRFIYPSELDLMARLAGLEPEIKWSDWNQAPFTSTSSNLIAVYKKKSTT